MSTSGDVSGEDTDDPSSIHNLEANAELDDFREQWQQELQITESSARSSPAKGVSKSVDAAESKKSESDESKARDLFMRASECERRGKVYDAMQLYRRAVQIVPDIESRIYEAETSSAPTTPNILAISSNSASTECAENAEDKSDEENLTNVDLCARFEMAIRKRGYFCEPTNAEPGVIVTNGLHINCLPMEILLFILRWVVSMDLDVRSLEQFGTVCRGFYIFSRDPEIWRLACLRIWGINLGTLNSSPYDSWRTMFVERSRVHFNGCYISKTSYLRYGENSFQDQFYRPIQLIEYYRLVRFFPDGQILMMTSADEPAQCVGKLKNRNIQRPEILRGHFRLLGDSVLIVLKKNSRIANRRRINNNNNNNNDDDSDGSNYTFYLELVIVSSTKKRFNQLKWKDYSIVQAKNKENNTTDFELSPAKYPALWFSRVKSYDTETDSMLN